MTANPSILSDAALVEELTLVHESLDSLSDWTAEIRGERAHYGDSGPGTQKVLDAEAEALGRLKELSNEWNRRNPRVAAPVDESEIPF